MAGGGTNKDRKRTGATRQPVDSAAEVERAEAVLRELRSLVEIAQLHASILELNRRLAALETGSDPAPPLPKALQPTVDAQARSGAVTTVVHRPAWLEQTRATSEEDDEPYRSAPARAEQWERPARRPLPDVWSIPLDDSFAERMRQQRAIAIKLQRAARRARRWWTECRRELAAWGADHPKARSWGMAAMYAARLPLVLVLALLLATQGVLFARKVARWQYDNIASGVTETADFGVSRADTIEAGYIFDSVFATITDEGFRNIQFESDRSPFATYVVNGRAALPAPSYLEAGSLDDRAWSIWALGLNAPFDDDLRTMARSPAVGDLMHPTALGFSSDVVLDMAKRGQCYPLSRLASQAWLLTVAQHGPRRESSRSEDLLLAAIASDFEGCVTDRAGLVADLVKIIELGRVSAELEIEPARPAAAKAHESVLLETPAEQPIEAKESEGDKAEVEAAPIMWRVSAPTELGRFATQMDRCADPAWLTSQGQRASARAYILGVIASKALEMDRADSCFAKAVESPNAALSELAQFMRARSLFWRYAYGEGVGQNSGQTDSPISPCKDASPESSCAVVYRTLDDLHVLFDHLPKQSTMAGIERSMVKVTSPALRGDLVDYLEIVRNGE